MLQLLASLPPLHAALECASGKSTTLPLGAGRPTLKLRHSTWQDSGTGGFVWHAGKVLCEWQQEQALAGSSVLELGAGTGACGLVAAGLGASRVLLTDGGPEPLLQLAERNVALNRAAFPDADVGVLRYSWGDDLPEPIAAGRWDFVLASDVLYSRRTHEPFCGTVRALLRPPGGAPPPRVVVAHQHRPGDPPLADFCKTVEASGLFSQVERKVERCPDGEDEPSVVSILRVW